MTDHEQRICDEYSSLFEKSQQLFAGLRDLPQFGKQWLPYFQKTFEVYTKLWKFQQMHRNILENKERYGLKRWDIGEIASKIGQLYYHFYLRTSETNYLNESYIFYEAIRTRGYFKDVLETKNASLMVKKLRYYARYLVVCLLLNKRALVRELVDSLQKLVEDYIKTFRPTDTQEWQLVLHEIALFLQGEGSVEIVSKGKSVSQSSRIKSSASKLCWTETMAPKIKLQEAILVGNYQHQVKFSELTLDMFRMMQALEREPLNHDDLTDSKESATEEDKHKKRANPHKYLLYRPSLSQLLICLSTAYKDLQENQVFLVYLSADGYRPLPPPDKDRDVTDADSEKEPTEREKERKRNSARTEERGVRGGVLLNPRKAKEGGVSLNSNCLYWEDLFSFTRKPLFLIVDSDCSFSFKSIQAAFGAPVVCLMSPESFPNDIKEASHTGNMFTYFLHDSISALCCITNKTSLPHELYEKCNSLLHELFASTVSILTSISVQDDPNIGTWKYFLREEALCLFILRYIFCFSVLKLHKLFQGKREFLPDSQPEMSKKVLCHTLLTEGIIRIASELEVTQFFNFPQDETPPNSVPEI